jgi:hypothetical protein
MPSDQTSGVGAAAPPKVHHVGWERWGHPWRWPYRAKEFESLVDA